MNNLYKEVKKRINDLDWSKKIAHQVIKKRDERLIKRSKIFLSTIIVLLFLISFGIISSNMNLLEAEETDPLDIIVDEYNTPYVYTEVDNFIEVAFKD